MVLLDLEVVAGLQAEPEAVRRAEVPGRQYLSAAARMAMQRQEWSVRLSDSIAGLAMSVLTWP